MVGIARSPIAQGSQATIVVERLQIATRFINDPGFELRGHNVPIAVYRPSELIGRLAAVRDLARADVAGDDLKVAGLRSHGADDIQCSCRPL